MVNFDNTRIELGLLNFDFTCDVAVYRVQSVLVTINIFARTLEMVHYRVVDMFLKG